MDAAEDLALLGQKSGVDCLLDCIHDLDADVREIAIEILEDLDHPRARQALRKLRM